MECPELSCRIDENRHGLVLIHGQRTDTLAQFADAVLELCGHRSAGEEGKDFLHQEYKDSKHRDDDEDSPDRDGPVGQPVGDEHRAACFLGSTHHRFVNVVSGTVTGRIGAGAHGFGFHGSFIDVWDAETSRAKLEPEARTSPFKTLRTLQSKPDDYIPRAFMSSSAMTLETG